MKKKMIGVLLLAGAAVMAGGIYHGSGKDREPAISGTEEAFSGTTSGAGEDMDKTIDGAEGAGTETGTADAPDKETAPDDGQAGLHVSDQETEITEKSEAATEGFQVNGMDGTLLSLVGTEEALKDNLQEQLYAYGYYDYSSAEILEYTYDENSVDIVLSVEANMAVNAEMIYSIDADTWQLKIW